MASPPGAFERADAFGALPLRGPDVPMSAADGRGYAPVYYPGTTSSAGATFMTLGVSEEKAAVDLQLPLVPMGRVQGHLVSPDGSPTVGALVQLAELDESLPGLGRMLAAVGPDGSFSFANVAPGRYRVHARTGPTRKSPSTQRTPARV